ncbi:MAG: hypothetical protein K8F62_17065, partial [Pseudorhodoplanes sp.]|nr:hypothetical protein [Pseudorhodoplanes sp.]
KTKTKTRPPAGSIRSPARNFSFVDSKPGARNRLAEANSSASQESIVFALLGASRALVLS